MVMSVVTKGCIHIMVDMLVVVDTTLHKDTLLKDIPHNPTHQLDILPQVDIHRLDILPKVVTLHQPITPQVDIPHPVILLHQLHIIQV